MVAIAREEPSFAGVYIDGNGSFVVQVVDPARSGPAESAVRRHTPTTYLAQQKQRAAPIYSANATYTFQQLSDWRDLVVDSLLGANGVVMDDLDEVRNQVSIGVDRDQPGAAGRLTARLAQLGIPRPAVNIEITAPAYPATLNKSASIMLSAETLSSSTDTLGGGISVGTSPRTCSTSIVADRSSTPGFITAAHCYECDVGDGRRHLQTAR